MAIISSPSLIRRTKAKQQKAVQQPSDYDAVSYTDTHKAIMRPSAQITAHMPDGGWAALLPVLVIAGSACGLVLSGMAWVVLSYGF